MNTLELLKVSRKKQSPISINPTSSIRRPSHKKPPQSRLSYLKKLFSKKNLTESEPNKNQTLTEEELKAFAKSRITINSNKNLQKMQLRQINSHLPSSPLKTITRYNSIDQNHFFPSPKPDHNKEYNQSRLNIQSKSTHLKIRPDPSPLNTITQLTKDKFFERHRKIASQGYENGMLNKSAVQSIHGSPRYEKTQIANQSFIETAQSHLKKKQIKQLKKIGRMLDDIKCQILKNRSVIIQGMKQIKHLENVKVKRIEFQSKEKVDYFRNIVQDYEQLMEKQSLYREEEKSADLKDLRYSHDPRPKVEYRKIHRIR